ncbi:MAG: S9 family peptidase [Planctomycetes bacterium]|nr:S9 family peptidase [Planctomycetota bacterium]
MTAPLRTFVGIMVSLLVASQVAGQDRKTRRPISLDDLARIVRVSDPQRSPDERTIVVVVSRPNYDKNRHDAELMLVNVSSRKQRVLTRDRQGVMQPRWSPSGDRLAFLAAHGEDKKARPQIFVMPMKGGDAQRITDAPEGVAHFAWKPDGKDIAYAAHDERPNKQSYEKGEDAFEIDEGSFLDKSTPTPLHLWLISSEGGKAKRLTSGKWSLHMMPPPGPPASPLSWSPDGAKLLFVKQDRPQWSFSDRTTIQVLDVASGKMRGLTGRKSLESTPSFSPDGSQVAYWYWRDGLMFSQSEIWVAPSAGGEGRCVTRELDRCLYLSAWNPHTKRLVVGGNDRTQTSLWSQPLDGRAQRLDELGKVQPNWGFSVDAQVGKKVGGIALTGSEAYRPTELYYLSPRDEMPLRLTGFHRDFADIHLGKVETVTWQGPDDFEENGILIYPPGFNAKDKKKYPLVLLIHGGPMAASTEAFSLWGQLIAARGYFVFQPNYRGSDNMGYKYQKAVFNDAGAGPGRDVMAGLEEVKKRGFVDDARIAVSGWSYGGYMTTWLIGNYPNVWKTAIAGAAVTDWFDSYNLSDLRVYEDYVFGGSPWRDKEKAFREQSPITYAKKIKTPTLIVATTGDARVPITQSYRLYHALRDNGVPVRFVAYPVSGHFPGDPVRQRDLLRRWTDWLDQHLQK